MALTELKLFVAATNVHTGRIKVFEGQNSPPTISWPPHASPIYFKRWKSTGCLIGMAASWATRLFPLFYKTACPDIVIVQNPVERDATPRSAADIQDRLNEITFNGALLGEMRAIDFVNRLIDSGNLSRDEYMRPFVHRIDGGRC